MIRFTLVRNCVLVALLLVLSGCAELQVKRLAANDTTSEGVRYYASQPYLLVTIQPSASAMASDKPAAGLAKVSQPAVQTQIIWLPKINEQYAVRVKPGWGTVDGSVSLQNGWMLTDLGSTMDSKLTETITAISGLINNAADLVKLAAAGASDASALATGLYRIEFDPATGFVSKLVPVKLQ